MLAYSGLILDAGGSLLDWVASAAGFWTDGPSGWRTRLVSRFRGAFVFRFRFGGGGSGGEAVGVGAG